MLVSYLTKSWYCELFAQNNSFKPNSICTFITTFCSKTCSLLGIPYTRLPKQQKVVTLQRKIVAVLNVYLTNFVICNRLENTRVISLCAFFIQKIFIFPLIQNTIKWWRFKAKHWEKISSVTLHWESKFFAFQSTVLYERNSLLIAYDLNYFAAFTACMHYRM